MSTRFVGLAGMLLLAAPALLPAQGTGTVSGRVTRASDGNPVSGVSVTVQSTRATTVTGNDGRYTLERVPAGQQTLTFRWPGYQPKEAQVTVTAGGTVTADAVLEMQAVLLSEVIVSTASRAPERVVDAPAAISIVDIPAVQAAAMTGQVPRALAAVPGVDLVQNGVTDFNVNARGFNTTLNRRVLVLQDGRDLAVAFLGAQEWGANLGGLEEAGRIEMVRGPGSALYGANAFSGVMSVTTPTAREAKGTKVSLSGGELSTFRGDVSHAGVLGAGRFGYKLNAGYSQSDTWSRSRTNLNDLADEYREATDTTIGPTASFEIRALNGQTKPGGAGVPGEATGDRDPIQNLYGTGRFDYYAANGAVTTIEGGATQVQNELFVTGIGRVQVTKAIRPWTRVAWAHPNYNVMAWYSGRRSLEPQYSLNSGLALEEKSGIFHGEAQYNRSFMQDQATIVLGASARNYQVNTQLTLMDAADDDRSDSYYSGYGQAEYHVVPQVRLVAAARYDESNLFEGQFSPKGAIVVSPTDEHSVRFTVNRAFQTPNYSEFFLRVPAGAPANFSALEAGLRASPLGPALAGVPNGTLFTVSAAVPIWARGNPALDVEKVTAYELGYKGQLGRRVFVTVDGFFNRLTDFVTDLLPAPQVNSQYVPWTSPTQVPPQFRPALEQAVRDQLNAAGQTLAANALTRLADGSTAIVVSYGNAGKVDEKGVEIGASIAVTDEIRLGGNYTFFDFTVKDSLTGDVLIPNAPRHKGTLEASYRGVQGLELGVRARFVDSYAWNTGVFAGPVPASQTLDANASYRINNCVRVNLIATHVLDQQRHQMWGGSIIGRRVLGGVTATF
ncbi:MAG: TonB-dependent receptor [Gemmatimonadetes bacterium]|nr:TonB-dependent receptor [Gemmatimonadota bacterium]